MRFNRRTFLKFLTITPAALYVPSSIGKISTNLPQELMSNEELLQATVEKTPTLGTGMVIITYPGKPTMNGGKAKYNAKTNQTTHIFTESGTLNENS